MHRYWIPHQNIKHFGFSKGSNNFGFSTNVSTPLGVSTNTSRDWVQHQFRDMSKMLYLTETEKPKNMC